MDRSDDVLFVADTTIHVSDELADELADRKAPDESYEDVIRRLIERSEDDETDGGTDEAAPAAPDDDHGQVPPREGEPDPPDGSNS